VPSQLGALPELGFSELVLSIAHRIAPLALPFEETEDVGEYTQNKTS
jgi:hypothetical protein